MLRFCVGVGGIRVGMTDGFNNKALKLLEQSKSSEPKNYISSIPVLAEYISIPSVHDQYIYSGAGIKTGHNHESTKKISSWVSALKMHLLARCGGAHCEPSSSGGWGRRMASVKPPGQLNEVQSQNKKARDGAHRTLLGFIPSPAASRPPIFFFIFFNP